MSTNYEPTAEQVERMKRELAEIRLREFPTGRLYDTVARFILQRQHSREKGLRDAMQRVCDMLRPTDALTFIEAKCRPILADALAAHAALDAAPEPTLRSLFGNVREVEGMPPGTVILATSPENYVALKAAVERAERAK